MDDFDPFSFKTFIDLGIIMNIIVEVFFGEFAYRFVEYNPKDHQKKHTPF